MEKKKKDEKKQERLLNEYLKRLKTDKPTYYVKDTAEGSEESIEILFVLESPHKEEVASRKPLMGRAGEYVSDFLDCENRPFGENQKLFKSNQIGIFNVSNIPLQVIDCNKKEAEDIKDELKQLRESDTVNATLFSFFSEKIKKYTNVRTYVLCGAFAAKYFDKYILEKDNDNILKKQYKGEIEILKVPHPSYGHWQFIDKHKENLERLKEIFSKFKEK